MIFTSLLGVFGCAAESSEKAAANARIKTATAVVEKATVRATKARIVIPAGTLLKVSLIDPLSTETNSAGDHFLASLTESVVLDGTTILQKGTKVRGRSRTRAE